MNMMKTIATGLGTAMMATVLLASAASAAAVEPKNVALMLKNPNLGGCATSLEILARVSAKSPGQVKIRFVRKSDGSTGPWQIMNIVDNPNYGKSGALMSQDKYMGKWQVGGPFGVSYKEQFRIEATGAGKTKKSAWSKLVSKC